ncbi:nitrogenase molybdenum-iron protein alpha chain [Carboxydocella sp. JDF658]|uniref:nitrogenase molybdenum-iron protein alpha chain n=1 Tax=Carboxydocella sp. JDF658 TaxID=1926600 RepID=UPI0009ACE2DA|nr:nitrogenase molybdenum-iron protein alpha chain [Carboxydocella sp. JDF658]GAW32574.1 nitrogenase molybdenum-iron protein alpha chain [Carboxydocella sp. JDF658]
MAIEKARHKQILEKMLEHYPSKIAKERKQHMVVIDPAAPDQHILADVSTIPGIMTNRGCTYAGCKGVVMGPIKNVLHITHGPIGCGFYTWNTRRHFATPEEGYDYFNHYCLSTDMQEKDIVFGGEKKLYQAIKEAYEIFKPKYIGIYATCPVGLIGDDIHSVAKKAEEELGVKVLAFSCEGYKGVSQSAGHHIANNGVITRVVGTQELENPTPFDINIFGEYNIGGDVWVIKPLLERIGYRVVSVFTGDAKYEDLARAHQAKLSILMCHRSINYSNQMMEQKYGVPWLKVNYIGIEATIRSLREMARFFDDPQLTANTEKVIAEELAAIQPQLEYYRQRLKGKKVMIFTGGSRSHHYQELCADLGMEVIMAGYQFAHRDDYEGRKIIPEIKPHPYHKTIDDYTFKLQPGHKPPFDEQFIERKKHELPDHLMNYEGMMVHMKEGAFVIDDLNHYETEFLIKEIKPDLFLSGIKDRYVTQKMGIPSRQLHSYDYSGPYTGFQGAIQFARDMDMAINNPLWKQITPPWASM